MSSTIRLAAALLLFLPALRGQDESAAVPSTAVRYVNLLSSRDESRILLDDKIVVGNSLTGEVSDFTAVAPGMHRVKVIPRYGKGTLLEKSFQVAANTKTSLVLAGGPSKAVPTATGMVLPLVHGNSAPPPPAPGKPPVCTLIFANGDLRGPIKVGLKAGEATTSFNLPAGQTRVVEKCPITDPALQVAPLFKLATGQAATSMLNTFTPTAPGSYYCVFYSTGANYPTRALFLTTEANGDLGKPPPDDR